MASTGTIEITHAGHQQCVLRRVLALELQEADRHGPRIVGADQHQRDQELVPGREHVDDRQRRERRQRQRQHDPPEDRGSPRRRRCAPPRAAPTGSAGRNRAARRSGTGGRRRRRAVSARTRLLAMPICFIITSSGCSVTCTGTARPDEEEDEDRQAAAAEAHLRERIGGERGNEDAERHLDQDQRPGCSEVDREAAGLPGFDEIAPADLTRAARRCRG